MPSVEAQSKPELALSLQEILHVSIFFSGFPPALFLLALAGLGRRHRVALGQGPLLMKIKGPCPDRDDQDEEPDPANGIGLLQQLFPFRQVGHVAPSRPVRQRQLPAWRGNARDDLMPRRRFATVGQGATATCQCKSPGK